MLLHENKCHYGLAKGCFGLLAKITQGHLYSMLDFSCKIWRKKFKSLYKRGCSLIKIADSKRAFTVNCYWLYGPNQWNTIFIFESILCFAFAWASGDNNDHDDFLLLLKSDLIFRLRQKLINLTPLPQIRLRFRARIEQISPLFRTLIPPFVFCKQTLFLSA